MVANWLYGVARQTALKARATVARRKAREKQVTVMPEPEAVREDLWHDLEPLLDQELSCLPDKYRVPIVLCDLGGKTRREAARQLGVPDGTLAARLARARGLLARRLSRHGLAVSGGALAAVLARNVASAGVPASVVSATLKAASLLAVGQAAAAGLISAKVVALTQGVLRTMLLTKLKMATALLLAVAVSGAGGLLYQTQAAGRADTRNEPFAAATESLPGAADAPRQGQKSKDEVREAAIKALEQFGTSEETSDREAAIRALAEYRKYLREADEARQGDPIIGRFKYRIPFETGFTESKEGGRIEIREVWGTRPRIEVGGQYLVRGKYVLPPGERGMLYFYETAEGAWGMTATANLDLQYTAVDKQEGEFTLVHGMAGPGYFHLYLAAGERYSRTFANVYFGTGDNVWRKKP
jgi:hypothetical protein